MNRFTMKYQDKDKSVEYGAILEGREPQALLDKLGKLEDLEERLRMPLDVFLDVILNQREIYCIVGYSIDEYEVGIVLCNSFNEIRLQNITQDDCGVSTLGYLDDWFLTREEAERKIKEIKNES